MSLEDWWPSLPSQENEAGIGVKDIEGPDFKALERFHICGDHVPHDDWVSLSLRMLKLIMLIQMCFILVQA